MSLRLLIDEDSQSKRLVNTLKKSGHDILTINDAKISGMRDSQVLTFAFAKNRVLLTRNCRDFERIHLSGIEHAGVLAIYQERDFSKQMSPKDISVAIENLELSIIDFKNQFIPLNAWVF